MCPDFRLYAESPSAVSNQYPVAGKKWTRMLWTRYTATIVDTSHVSTFARGRS